jgi:hypothetical protein
MLTIPKRHKKKNTGLPLTSTSPQRELRQPLGVETSFGVEQQAYVLWPTVNFSQEVYELLQLEIIK